MALLLVLTLFIVSVIFVVAFYFVGCLHPRFVWLVVRFGFSLIVAVLFVVIWYIWFDLWIGVCRFDSL